MENNKICREEHCIKNASIECKCHNKYCKEHCIDFQLNKNIFIEWKKEDEYDSYADISFYIDCFSEKCDTPVINGMIPQRSSWTLQMFKWGLEDKIFYCSKECEKEVQSEKTT